MLFADLGLSFEPALPALGMPVLLVIALALAALTVWTYLGVKRATWRRVGTVVLLRLSALAAALLLLLRPSFAMTQLEGIETSKLFVLFDASESMSVADVDGQPTRWEQMNKLWESRDVQRRLDELKAVQKIEIVKYLAAEELRPDEAGAAPTGKRTDIGVWMQQLSAKHGHEKHLRGIVMFSDGADNGSRFAVQEQAGAWKGIAPIYAFGVGDPKNQKFKKDIGLTRIDAKPKPVIVKSKMEVNGIAQATGYEKAKVLVSVWIEGEGEQQKQIGEIKDFEIKQEKDQPIRVGCEAPDQPGEYKVTLKIAPQPDEANIQNNEISTYIQVIKPKLNILWVDRPRVYEPRFAIEALAKEERFQVHYVEPPSDPKKDPFEIYKLNGPPYDLIVIGDISAARFAQARPDVFERIKAMVTKGTALLMLGGEETFANGDWHKQPAIMALLPVKFDGPTAFVTAPVQVTPTPGAPKFLQLHPNLLENKKIWEDPEDHFRPLDGFAPLGSVVKDSTVLLGVEGDKKKPVMVATAAQNGLGGRVVVFAADTTSRGWYESDEAVQGHHVFWKQLIGWLARQEDNANELWIKLDKRRIGTDAGDVLGFTFGLRGKTSELPGAKFDAKIIGPKEQAFPVKFNRIDQHQRGSFPGAKAPGEYKIVIEGVGKDGDKDVKAAGTARFLVADDNLEMLRPAAEHETLVKIAVASDGQFHLAREADLLQLLDELKDQASRDARQKTTHWPDWQRLPPSDHLRDQLAGLWNSFAFVGFSLFVLLIGCEWTLRRLWGLV